MFVMVVEAWRDYACVHSPLLLSHQHARECCPTSCVNAVRQLRCATAQAYTTWTATVYDVTMSMAKITPLPLPNRHFKGRLCSGTWCCLNTSTDRGLPFGFITKTEAHWLWLPLGCRCA